MEKSQKALPPQVRAWVEARKRHRLSHAQVQIARELGLNPGKLGKISNHRQEPWKAPLPQFIEHLYLKRFGREQPRMEACACRAGQVEPLTGPHILTAAGFLFRLA